MNYVRLFLHTRPLAVARLSEKQGRRFDLPEPMTCNLAMERVSVVVNIVILHCVTGAFLAPSAHSTAKILHINVNDVPSNITTKNTFFSPAQHASVTVH